MSILVFILLMDVVCLCLAEAAQKMMDEMRNRFPDHGVMDALGVVYS